MTEPTPPQEPTSSSNPPSKTDEALEREIAEALGGKSVEELMAENEQAPQADAPAQTDEAGHPDLRHQVRRGRVAAIRGEDVFIELTGDSGKMQGVVPAVQFDRPPRLGSIMDFVVDHIDEAQGLIFLSREGAINRSTWEQLQRDAVVEARVVAKNKGGLELEMPGGIAAFMPASQVDLHHVDDLEVFVGQKLEAIVQEIDRKSKKVVLSRRHLLVDRQAKDKEKLIGELEVGQVREGKVSNIVDFGAFIDLGGIDGLVHVSDMSYSHVDKPKDVLKAGQAVSVKVLKIDLENQRISLGLKQVQPDPWETLGDKVKVGDQISARVIRNASFGSFIEVEPGIEGLLPISEISWKRIHKPDEVVKQGDVVRLAVIGVDLAKRRITLSLKQAQGDPWTGAEHKYAKDSLVEGKVLGTTDFGAFVELETGIEGLVHISELADKHVAQVTDVLNVGDVKQFRVLDISEDDRKVRLSLKAVDKPAGAGGDSHHKAGKHDVQQQNTRTAQRKPRKDLKGGMEAKSLGQGLGGLSLDDFK
jgi:small subunit ribosomal protein S1